MRYLPPLVGRTRFDRLLFIGKTCPPLCVDALKAAILEAKQGPDVTRYMEAWDCIRLAAPGEPEAQRDQAWIDRIEAENKAELSRLEAELKGYKNNLIKESIRVRALRRRVPLSLPTGLPSYLSSTFRQSDCPRPSSCQLDD